MKATIIGIDLAKEVFQVHGNDSKGQCLFRKRLRRGQLAPYIESMPQTTIAMEACSGAHWLARRFSALGHKVVLIAPQHVKPFVKSNKSDSADAEAICEAAVRPSMHFVAVKGQWHLDLQSLHRVRTCRVARRTAICNEIRALLTESGVVFAKGREQVVKLVPHLLQTETSLSPITSDLVTDLYKELLEISEKIEVLTRKLENISKENETCQRLLAVGGIGPITATALVAACPDPAHFRNGRHFAAWLGLVPRHSGTGGKNIVGSISRRGDPYIRTLLVHGARSTVNYAAKRTDTRSRWLASIKDRRGYNKATVALANKNARIVWSLMRYSEEYKAS